MKGKFECKREYSGENSGARTQLVAQFGLRRRDATSPGIALLRMEKGMFALGHTKACVTTSRRRPIMDRPSPERVPPLG